MFGSIYFLIKFLQEKKRKMPIRVATLKGK